MTETSTSTTNGPDAGTPQLRLRLTFDLDVDICIVGAGLAGLTVALEAARLGASIAVLEGRHVGWNASGHHLGTVMPGFGVPVGELIERIGMEDARSPYANVIAVRAQDKDQPWVAQLVAAYHSEPIKHYILTHYQDSVRRPW